MNQKGLQIIMSNVHWQAVEQAFTEYLMTTFTESSAKRDTEFDTVWNLAMNEGGKYHLQKFFAQMEQEAKKAI